jgi:dihydroorotate dehydrogenase (fumarate)
MDLSTTYLGLRLPHPFIAGASPLSATLEGARRLEDAGSAAIILPSLFEEGVAGGDLAVRSFYSDHDQDRDTAALPAAAALGLSPRAYLAHLGKVKKAVRAPVIASMNGTSPGDWVKYAPALEREGADALEINLYSFAAEPWDPGHAAELRMLELVRAIRGSVRIPLAIKLSPFYTSLPHFARELEYAGADAIIVFNRFYQADIDPERLELRRTLDLSSSSEFLLRLRSLAVLYGKVRPALGVSGGVHNALHAVKAILAGATVVQVVSALLENGVDYLNVLRQDTEAWFEQHHYDSLDAVRGRMSLLRAPDAKSYERMNYIYNLDSWYGLIAGASAVERRGVPARKHS